MRKVARVFNCRSSALYGGAGKEEERREREERAFMVRAVARPAAYTVPKPFALSTNNKRREDRTSKLRDEAERAAVKECTFRPKTLYSENRHILDSLLHEEY